MLAPNRDVIIADGGVRGGLESGIRAGSESIVPFFVEEHLEAFHRMFPGEMRVLEYLGIHPLRSHPCANPFDDRGELFDFRHIGEHSIAVTVATNVFAQSLISVEALEIRDYRRILLRALLHNVFKPYEIMWRATHGTDGTMPPEQLEECRRRVLRTLAQTRLPSHLMQEMLTAGREVSPGAIAEFQVGGRFAFTLGPVVRNVPVVRKGLSDAERFRSSLALGEKIIFLANLLTSSPDPRSPGGAAAERGPVQTVFTLMEDREDCGSSLGEYDRRPNSLRLAAGLAIAREIAGLILSEEFENGEDAQRFLLSVLAIELRAGPSTTDPSDHVG